MADVPSDPNAGASGTEYQLMAGLGRAGHTVDTVWSDQLPRRIGHGNLHYLVELPRAYRAAMLGKLATGRYDVIHVNQPHGYLAARTLRRMRSPAVFVHRSHGFEPLVEETLHRWRFLDPDRRRWHRRAASAIIGRALDRSARQIIRWADGHIVSATPCAAYLESLGVSSDRIATIGQAAPAEYLATPAPPMSPHRLRKLLYVGQFAFVKAPMVVAAAASRLLAAHPELTMTWVTSPSAHAAVTALLDPAVRPRVSLAGWRTQEALREIYDDHGLLLFTSFFEGFGKVMIEAMARGLCVVASNTGGAHDLVVDGVNGFRVPVGDDRAVAAAAERLLADDELARRMSGAAAQTAREWTWDRAASETAAFYERLRAMKQRPPGNG